MDRLSLNSLAPGIQLGLGDGGVFVGLGEDFVLVGQEVLCLLAGLQAWRRQADLYAAIAAGPCASAG